MSREIEELLPFYANRTLAGEEKAMVEKALADDAELRAELELLEKLRQEMQALEYENSPGEFGWQRLKRSLDVERRQTAPVGLANDNVPGRGRLWRYAAIAACLLLVVQTIAYFPAGDDTDIPAASGVSGFVVTFAPDATEADITALLIDLDAKIVSGPSSEIGREYTLSIADADIEAVLAQLRAAGDVVETSKYEPPAAE